MQWGMAKITTNNHLEKSGILKKSAPAIFSWFFVLGHTRGRAPGTNEKVTVFLKPTLR